jgi:dienelactone hydrolase
VNKTKYPLFLLGIILSIPILVLLFFALTLPITISGIGYLFACSLAVSGLILAPWMRKYHWLTLAGVLALVLIAGGRIFMGAQNASSHFRMVTLPQGKSARWISYILDEQDSVIFGEAFFHRVGGSSATEHASITEALYQDYSAMRQVQGIFPSPFANTYLNLQNAEAFDAVIIEPENNRHPEIGVIFLHGFMGNVAAQCWEIAQAVSQFGAVTACPSTGWIGEWWQPQGQATIRSTFEYLRGQGIQKIYLGGFSNGGFGISRLASQLGDEDGLSGLFFIDGINADTSIKQLGLPVLIIQGTQDERMPASEASRIAEDIGDLGTYVELDSDHFLIMKIPELVQKALTAWLEDREPAK